MKGLERHEVNLSWRRDWIFCPLRQIHFNMVRYKSIDLQILAVTQPFHDFHKKRGENSGGSQIVYGYLDNNKKFQGYYNIPYIRP